MADVITVQKLGPPKSKSQSSTIAIPAEQRRLIGRSSGARHQCHRDMSPPRLPLRSREHPRARVQPPPVSLAILVPSAATLPTYRSREALAFWPAFKTSLWPPSG